MTLRILASAAPRTRFRIKIEHPLVANNAPRPQPAPAKGSAPTPAKGPAPRSTISKDVGRAPKSDVFHDGVCLMKESGYECTSTALHEFTCGHLLCAECIVAHLKQRAVASKKRDFGRRRSRPLTEATLNMKTRKLMCFKCKQHVQCGCASASPRCRDRAVGVGCFVPHDLPLQAPPPPASKRCTRSSGGSEQQASKAVAAAARGDGRANVSVEKQKYTYVVRNKGSRCEHGRMRYTCRDCGGSGRCCHGRNKRHCREGFC